MRYLVKLLLSSPHIRIGITRKLIKHLDLGPYVDPQPIFLTWLNEAKDVNLDQIRRLALVNFIGYQRIVDYYGKNFSTKLTHNRNWGIYPHNWIFLIYNVLSEGPITSHAEYYEQIRGISSNIDLLRRTFDFVVGNLKLDIEFTADQENYELGNPVKLSLVLKNLTDEEIVLSNPSGPTVEFIVEGSSEKINKLIKWSTKSENEDSNRLILSPYDNIVLKWSPESLPEGIYLITAQVYIPHYEQLEEFRVHIRYGKPDETLFVEPYIRDFFAV